MLRNGGAIWGRVVDRVCVEVVGIVAVPTRTPLPSVVADGFELLTEFENVFVPELGAAPLLIRISTSACGTAFMTACRNRDICCDDSDAKRGGSNFFFLIPSEHNPSWLNVSFFLQLELPFNPLHSQISYL